MPHLRVLLIDDLPEMRRLVEMWLEATPVVVVGQAGSCAEAFPVIERQRPDVVVMDFHMPNGDGVECTAAVTARHPDLLVVGFASTDDAEVERRMREAGAVAWFHKSRLEELVAYLTSPELRARVRRPPEG